MKKSDRRGTMMGKRVGFKVGRTYYDARLATDWERLEKLEANGLNFIALTIIMKKMMKRNIKII